MMVCKKCGKGRLVVARGCRRVRMRCEACGREFHIHEVADILDAETEEKLACYTAIIYD